MPKRFHYRPGRSSQINSTTVFALIFHGLLIFGVSIAYSPAISENKQLEVALSVASSEDAPDEADFIAETNQIGSGTLEKAREMTQLSKAIHPDKRVHNGGSIFAPATSQETYKKPESHYVTTTGVSGQTIVMKEIDFLRHQKSKNKVTASEYLAMLDSSIASMEAKVAEALQAEAKRPRSLILDSTSSLAAEDASYVRSWRDKVEAIGNKNYPKHARDQGLYGNVRLVVTVLASGAVEDIKLLEPSGSPVLDEAAIQSIWQASPFEPFGENLASKYDQIEIVRTWQFQKNRISTLANARSL